MFTKFFLNKLLWSNTPINRFNKNKNIKKIQKLDIIEKTDVLTKAVEMPAIIDLNLPMPNLNEIKNITELNTYIKNYESCVLKHTANHTVVGSGDESSKVLLVGEAPGEEEDRQGLPFVGRSGILLRKMIKYAQIDENKIYITNVIPWRPEGNRTPTTEEIKMCVPFLKKRIELMQPEYILLVGSVAAKALLDTKTPMMKLRSMIHNVTVGDKTYKTIVTFHPSFLLRSPSYKVQAKDDMDFIRDQLQKDNILDSVKIFEPIIM